MEENVYSNQEEVSKLKILKKRDGNKLYVANAGCKSLIGIIENVDNSYYIEGYSNCFDKEQDALDVLIGGNAYPQ